MKDPAPETRLACRLMCILSATINLSDADERAVASAATRVCALARTVRRLNEQACNRELTNREAAKLTSAGLRACEILKPYGLEIGNPYGLVMYAMPIGSDGTSSTGMVQL